MRRLPPYMIIAVCGILFLSAGMVIITADSTEPSAQPTATVDIPTPTDIVSAPVDQSAPAVAAPIVVQPTDVPVQPVVLPTEVIVAPVIVPTDVIQPVQSASVDEQQAPPTAVVETQIESQPAVGNVLPMSPVPADAGAVVPAPVIEQPNAPLGTLPPPANVSPTAENPVVIPNIVLPTVQPTTQTLETLPVLMQVTGQIGVPLRPDYSGIVVTLTLPDGRALQTITDSAGNFTFTNLPPGTYRVDAGVSGYLSSQTSFSLLQGQNVILPSAVLVGGDTNLDNKIDLTDAALIAANFDSTTVVAGADLNHDGIVDIRDLTAIGAYFGLVGPTQWKS